LFDSGEWDGGGAVLKTKIRMEQLRQPDRRLQNAHDVVGFLRETLSERVHMSFYRKNKGDISRHFHEIPM
jgi:hypothetical protein